MGEESSTAVLYPLEIKGKPLVMLNWYRRDGSRIACAEFPQDIRGYFIPFRKLISERGGIDKVTDLSGKTEYEVLRDTLNQIPDVGSSELEGQLTSAQELLDEIAHSLDPNQGRLFG